MFRRTFALRLVGAIVLLAALPVAAVDTVFVNDFQNAPLGRGGSNMLWYDVDRIDPDHPDPIQGCIDARERYGIIANYHRTRVRQRVRAQLVNMRAHGQERIATGLAHLRTPGPAPNGSWGGTLVDSTGGDLHPRIRQNLIDFLADIRDSGFRELLFRYFPQGGNMPSGWDSFQDDLFEENWNLIRNVEPILEASGLVYRTDLWVEGMPRAYFVTLPNGNYYIDSDRPHRRAWSDYARRLWRAYVAEFGHEHSVGFSFVTDANRIRTRARVRHLPYVYELEDGSTRYPGVFALDIYGGGSVDEGEIFRRHHEDMVDIGQDSIGWIIAESWFNDETAAAALRQAMEDTGRTVHYFMQWPFDRDTDDCGVNVAPPTAFGNYLRHGF